MDPYDQIAPFYDATVPYRLREDVAFFVERAREAHVIAPHGSLPRSCGRTGGGGGRGGPPAAGESGAEDRVKVAESRWANRLSAPSPFGRITMFSVVTKPLLGFSWSSAPP